MKKFIIGLLIGLGFISTIALGGTILTTGTNLFPQQGGTGLRLQPAKGDLLVGSSTTQFGHITVGTNDQCLIADSTQPLGIKWGSCGGTANVIFRANGGDFVTTSTIDFQEGTNITITTSTTG